MSSREHIFIRPSTLYFSPETFWYNKHIERAPVLAVCSDSNGKRQTHREVGSQSHGSRLEQPGQPGCHMNQAHVLAIQQPGAHAPGFYLF
jgi:hypothetical protein